MTMNRYFYRSSHPFSSGIWSSHFCPFICLLVLLNDTHKRMKLSLLLLLLIMYSTALSPSIDCGIIGCGPSGLALAHSLLAEGHTVRVFERRDEFRPVGAAVFLHPFALNSLRKVSPKLESQLLEASTRVRKGSTNP